MKTVASVLVVAALALIGWTLLGPSASNPASRPAAETPEGTIENDPRVSANSGASSRLSKSLESMLVGEWRSVDDSAYVRVFLVDQTFHEVYDGEPAGAPGTWAFATDGSGELRLSSEGEVFRFKLVDVTPDELSMVYLDRGGVLRYERVR